MWLWLWFLFVLLLLVLPLGYGWGYRRWGPPYPRYGRRRRPPGDAVVHEDTDSWGFLGELVWIVLVIALVWLTVGWLA